ncbi:two-component response regulator ORR42-like [Lolium rigidum]|uniref:two-component response regulator ORR42-like n=1 Tax=Lolium rigidum TaxID=89674 RepID=UPI001F5C3ACB|nr:two-component response regulator ORR42-like [Lolium rigidum]XP_047063210.1 two-component response regulator ORR42-like [Lolium rigidum]XP_051212162.1 two-component response regulator ORR42-like [Lolium perenne]
MASNAQGSPVKALLVDDTAVDALILSTKLRKFHCETTVAKTGKEALDLFHEGKKFDIVLCDKDMPIMNGLEAVEKIRAMGEIDVKIVGLSADYDATEVFMSAGADAFVPKPMKLDVLSAIIQEVINKKNNTMV